MIGQLYRRVLRMQRHVLAGDHQAIIGTTVCMCILIIVAARNWTRNKFTTATNKEQLCKDMDGLCLFMERNLAQCQSEDGGRTFKLQWRPTLEINDTKNNPVKSPCGCC